MTPARVGGVGRGVMGFSTYIIFVHCSDEHSHNTHTHTHVIIIIIALIIIII